jgi:ribosomal protein S18 acetylase RimI-like enzyme
MIGAGIKRTVRRAKPSDNAALATIFADSWRLAYRGIIPHAHLECLIRRRGTAWWAKAIRTESHLLVIEIEGKVAGYASCGATRNHTVYKGEIYELYLAPVYQGLGLGEYLFEACRHELDMRGLDGLVVWALEDNDAAAAFYWRRGGRPVTRTTERFGTTKLGKIAYGWH